MSWPWKGLRLRYLGQILDNKQFKKVQCNVKHIESIFDKEEVLLFVMN